MPREPVQLRRHTEPASGPGYGVARRDDLEGRPRRAEGRQDHGHRAARQPVPAKRFRSVYLDTGQSGRGPRGIALAAKVFGADRILFGTDSGPNSLVGQTIAMVKQAVLTAEEKQQILVGNGRRLLEARGIK